MMVVFFQAGYGNNGNCSHHGDGCGDDGNSGHYGNGCDGCCGNDGRSGHGDGISVCGGGSNYSCDLVMVSDYPNVNHRSISEALTLKAETRTTTLRC